jgi:hypothetical protein
VTTLAYAALAGLLLVGLPIVAVPAHAADPAPRCADSPRRVGACFTVHGRVTSCTAVPSVRIWIIGTKRILGVEDGNGNPAGDNLLPGELEDELSTPAPCSKAGFGDFTVCPLTPNVPGIMQRVCVVSVSKIILKEDW